MPVAAADRVSRIPSIGAPFLCSAARIAKTGHVMADMISKDGQRVKNQALFRSTNGMEREFRGFADRLELADDERIETVRGDQALGGRRLPARSAHGPGRS